MSNTLKNPYFHLKLDSLTGNEGTGYTVVDCVSSDTYVLVPAKTIRKRNPLTGYSMEFPVGDSVIKLPAIEMSDVNGFSIMFWYRAGGLKGSDNTVLRVGQKGSDETFKPLLVLHSSQSEYIQLSIGEAGEDQKEIEIKEGPNERLKHFCITFGKGNKLSIYINGESVHSSEKEMAPALWNAIELGSSASTIPLELSQYRLHREALSGPEVIQFYIKDLEEGAAEAQQPLVLHLPMDEIRSGSLRDMSGSWNVALVAGTPDIVYDEEMGSALMFNNELDRINVKSLPWYNASGIAFSIWIYIDKGKRMTIFELSDGSEASKEQGAFSLVLDAERKIIINYGGKVKKFDQTVLPKEKWMHLAFSCGEVLAKDNYKLWIDGIDYSVPEETNSVRTFEGTRLSVSLGNSSKGGQPFFGRMGHFRLYKTEIAQDEVNIIRTADKNSGTNSKNIYPIEFRLETAKENESTPVLYIEQAEEGDVLELEVRNVSGGLLRFNKLPEGTLSSEQYHFQLKFRKGVLSEPTMRALQAMELKAKLSGASAAQTEDDLGRQWAIVTDFENDASEDVISIGFTGDRTLDKSEPLKLLIPNMSASANGGARNTRVELLFDNMELVAAPGQNLSGFMVRQLQVINQAGLKNIPLMAFIDGANMMLNDGVSVNNFKLVIFNSHTEKDLKLSSSTQGANKASKFTLRFSNPDIIKGTDFKAKLGGGSPLSFNVEAPTKGEKTWLLTFNGNPDTGFIKAQKAIVVEVENWVTEFKSGIVNLFIDYKNIPGYWDGTLVVPIDLGLLVEKDKKLGIGTVDPKARLHVSGGQLMIEGDGIKGTGLVIGDGSLEKSGYMYHFTTTKGNQSIVIAHTELNANNISDTAHIRVEKDCVYIGGKARIEQLSTPNLEVAYLTVFQKLNLHASLEIEQGIKASRITADKIHDRFGELLPVGTVVAYAGQYAPQGWLICNGQSIPNEYADLRALLGNNVPDLRNRFIAGAGNQYNLGTTGGANEVTLTEGQMPQHRHLINDGAFLLHYESFSGHSDKTQRTFKSARGNHTWDTDLQGTNYTGGNQPHENRPPYYALYYIIKC